VDRINYKTYCEDFKPEIMAKMLKEVLAFGELKYKDIKRDLPTDLVRKFQDNPSVYLDPMLCEAGVVLILAKDKYPEVLNEQ
jgi:hypothetical protein